MKIINYLVWLTLAAGIPAAAQTAAIRGNCEQGAYRVSTSGQQSTTAVMRSFPRCTVDVYLSGTTNHATIYDTATNHVLANPFTANADGSWIFWTAIGGIYDVTMSNGTSPNVLPAPITLAAISLLSGGAGGITNFTSGNLSPLFTTSVANPTTTPALSFNLTTASNSTIFGNFSGSTAAPQYVTLVAGSNITFTPGGFGTSLTISASGGGTGCTVGVTSGDVLFSTGTGCTGSDNFITNALGQVQVLNGGATGGGATASFQVSSFDTPGFNYFLTDGNSVTYRGTGASNGGQFAPGFIINIDDGDMISGGSAPNGIIGNFITTGVYRAGKNAIGVESLPAVGASVAAGNITNFEADEPTFGSAATLTNHDGFIASGVPSAAAVITGYNYYFHSVTSSGTTLAANFCDFVGNDVSSAAIRVKLGCGATGANTFTGPTTVGDLTITGTCTGCGGIANIQITLPTSLINANTCTSPATATMTGLTTTSGFATAFATNPNAVVGWGSTGGLNVTMWPTANTVNWSVCNPTASGITPGAMTLIVGAR